MDLFTLYKISEPPMDIKNFKNEFKMYGIDIIRDMKGNHFKTPVH